MAAKITAVDPTIMTATLMYIGGNSDGLVLICFGFFSNGIFGGLVLICFGFFYWVFRRFGFDLFLVWIDFELSLEWVFWWVWVDFKLGLGWVF